MGAEGYDGRDAVTPVCRAIVNSALCELPGGKAAFRTGLYAGGAFGREPDDVILRCEFHVPSHEGEDVKIINYYGK